MVTTASRSSYTLYACNSPCQGTAKSHGCKPSHYPERTMGQEGQGTNQRQRSTPDLTPSPGAHPCSEMANNRPLPLSPFKTRKAKNSSSVAFGVWKGPRCDNRVLHTTPHKSKTTVTGKASECLHLAWCFRSPSSVLIQHQSVSRKSNRCSRPTSGYSVCTDELADVLRHHLFIHDT